MSAKIAKKSIILQDKWTENKKKNQLVFSEISDKESEWQDMPEYIHPGGKAFKSIRVHFKDVEGYKKFIEIVGQPFSMSIRSIWYPRIDNQNVSIYVDTKIERNI